MTCSLFSQLLTCRLSLSLWLKIACLAGMGLIFCSVGRAAHQQKPYWATGREVFIKHCAVCHRSDSGTRAPLPAALRQMSRQAILQALETGVMKAQGSSLTAEERRDVASFLARHHHEARPVTTGFCQGNSDPLRTGVAGWNGWGPGATNARFQTANEAGLNRNQVKRLRLKWAFGFPGSSTAQPTVSGGRVLVGSTSGSVYSLDAQTGCVGWIFKASSGVRASVSVSADGRKVYVADSGANVYALNAATGKKIWETHVDPHPLAKITGAPLLLDERLYVPVSSGEEGAAVNPFYECCTFRGSVVALDAATGKEVWKAYSIPSAPKPIGNNALGVRTWGPSGAAIWSAPAADIHLHAIYVATGNNYSDPGDKYSDAILAFDLRTGKMLWSHQVTPHDRWTIACLESDKTNCPPNSGDDYDFGAAPILVSLPNGRALILAAQKSGVVYALDPDQHGNVVWERRIAAGGPEGGIEWGGAAGGGQAYYPISDWKQSVPDAGGGLVALQIATGKEVWHARRIPPDCGHTPGCSAAQIAPVTVIPGVVFSGSMDGHLRAYDANSGRIIWDFNTAQTFETVDGITAHGGSLNKNGPTLAGGMLFIESGNFVGMPGNVLLAFSAPAR